MTTPLFEAVASARGAAVSIWKIIDRKSAIDPLNEDGVKPEKFQGDVEFSDIKFHYPSRPEVPVSKNH